MTTTKTTLSALAAAIALASAPVSAFVNVEPEEASKPAAVSTPAPVVESESRDLAAEQQKADREAEILKQLEAKRQAKARAEAKKRQEAAAKKARQAADEERRLVELKNEVSEMIPSLQDPKNFKAMQKVYGKMWKIDSKSDHVRDARYSIAQFLTNTGHAVIKKHNAAFDQASARQKDAVVAKIPEFADRADEFLKESRWYVKESNFQTQLAKSIEQFRSEEAAYAKSKAEYKANHLSVGDVADGVGTVGKKTWEVTKNVGSGLADLGGKAADRFKTACWWNCESKDAPQEAEK